jgi:hypothetical protein
MNKKLLVLNYLEKNGSITAYEANEEFGIVGLKEIIEKLREDGHNIIERRVKFKRNGKRIEYPKYILEVQNEQD